MIFVAFVVLVVSGVQHVDCVTFSTLNSFLMKHAVREGERQEKGNERKREIGRGRERKSKRRRKRKEKRKRKRKGKRKRQRKRKKRLLL